MRHRRPRLLRRPGRLLAAVAAVTLGALALVASPSSAGAAPTRPLAVAGPLVAVGTAAAVPAGAERLGAAPASSPLTIELALAPRRPAALRAFIAAVATPGSADYHRYVTVGAFARRYGADAATLAGLEQAATRAGLSVGTVAPNRLSLELTGPTGRVAAFVHSPIDRFRLASGAVAFANSAEPRLAASLAAVVQAVVGLSDLDPRVPADLDAVARATRSAAGATRPATGATAPTPCTAASEAGGYTANQIADMYGLPGLYAAGDFGQGVTVGVYELEPDLPSDIAAYQSCYGTSTTVHYVEVDGGAGSPGPGEGEAALDIEDVLGLAPEATLDVYQGPNNNVGPYDVYAKIISSDKVQVITTSWGLCESQLGRAQAIAENTLFEEAAAQGETIVAASGDDGSTDCTNDFGNPYPQLAVDDPGSQPYVTSVGGVTTPNVADHATERAWNDGSGAGGGGISQLWPMPTYQTQAPYSLHVIDGHSSAKPCALATGYCREVPDVSANADPSTPYVDYWNYGWGTIGGTSAAAPVWAAITALADASKACGGRAVGFLNPALYAIASSHAYAQAFTDVTKGNNDDTLSGYDGRLYPAGAGFDMATGLGTPLATNKHGVGLANRLCTGSPAPGPGVLALVPAHGPVAGGTQVTIHGYGFAKVTAVGFGFARAKFRVVSKTEIVATAPKGAGHANVTVTAHGRTSPLNQSDVFAYR